MRSLRRWKEKYREVRKRELYRLALIEFGKARIAGQQVKLEDYLYPERERGGWW